MRLEGPVPEGGWQDPKEYGDATANLRLNRCPARCMFPGEFLAILQDNLHPRLSSIGVAQNEEMERHRKNAGISSCGTIWIATTKKREALFAVPADCFPFTSIRRYGWDEEKARFSNDTHLARGWRKSLQDLIELGVLKATEELSWMIGKEAWALQPKKFRL